jgi:hypothetical protein
MKIEALVISNQEPQLERCLAAVHNQTVPFSNIVHIDGVAPEYIAHNTGMQMLTAEWAFNVNGDTILVENAVELALKCLEDHSKEVYADKVYSYNFGLYDTFLRTMIAGCSFFRVPICKPILYEDRLDNDLKTGPILRRKGYIIRHLEFGRRRITVGTHFDNPDEFQVFRRFYAKAMKRDSESIKDRLLRLKERYKLSVYDLALQALEFGKEKNSYPTSHDINFDREMFEEFKLRKGIKQWM